MNRTIVIGDMHGCWQEFQQLLEKCGVDVDDRVIALGDIVDRGPASLDVLDYFRHASDARSLKGNHERKHVRSYHGEINPADSQRFARREIGEEMYPDAVTFMDSLPHYIDLPEALLVHGFYEPGVALEEQRTTVLVGTMSGQHYLEKKYNKPWYDLYDEDKPLVVGHLNYLKNGDPLIVEDRVYAIDTGCCKGGRLTALILPDFELVSVPAERNWWQEIRQQYTAKEISGKPPERMTWRELEAILQDTQTVNQTAPINSASNSEAARVKEEAEDLLEEISQLVIKTNEQTMRELRQQYDWDEFSPSKQGRLYDQHIGNRLLAPFLHKARRGEFDIDTLKQKLKTPSAVFELAEKLQKHQ